MIVRSKISREGENWTLTLKGDNGFSAYFTSKCSVSLIKNAKEMLSMMNIKCNILEEEEEKDRSKG